MSLVEIDLDSNGITGSIPSSLGDLSMLEILDVDQNALTGTIPTELFQVQGLKVIDLDKNNLSGSIPTEASTLSALYFLQLDFNSMTGPVPFIENLEYLSLFGNQFTGSLDLNYCGIHLFANCELCTVAECCTACLET